MFVSFIPFLFFVSLHRFLKTTPTTPKLFNFKVKTR